MNVRRLLQGLLLALVFIPAVTRATLVGYDVNFTTTAQEIFFSMDSASGMIYIDDTQTGGVFVDEWMFDFNWSLPFTGGTGSDSFAGGSCLLSGCSTSDNDFVFDTNATTLAGQVTVGSTIRLDIFPSNGFSFALPGGTSAASGTISLTPKAVPAPAPLLLVGIGLLGLGACRKSWRRRAPLQLS